MSKVSVVLFGVLVLQGAVLGAVVFGSPRHWQPPEVQLPAQESLVPVSLQSVTLSDSGFAEQVERPIFVAGRRPVTAEQVPNADEATKDMLMLGLFGPDHGAGGAIVSLSGSIRRVAIGAKVGALTLRRIEGLNAVFWDGAAEKVLRLQPIPRPAGVPTAAGGSPKRKDSLTPLAPPLAVDEGDGVLR